MILVVTVNKQSSGYYFGLSPKVRKAISEQLPGALPLSHIFIAYDVKNDFEEMYGHVEKHLLPVLTGVELDALSGKVTSIHFVDPNDDKKPIYIIEMPHVEETEFISG